MLNQHAMSQYQRVNNEAGVAAASPHRLIQMLMNGCLQRVAEARGAVQRGDVGARGEALGKAISIVGGLRESLNHEAAPELSGNLEELYSYMQRRLLEANRSADEAILVEVANLMQSIKEAWDGIAPAAVG